MDEAEQRLIHHAQQGDRQAFADLYERYQPAIYNYLYYRIDDPDCAEELTCEIFASMVQSVRHYRTHGQPFLAWLYTIARNLRIDYYRENGKVQMVELNEMLLAEEPDPAETLEIHLKAACMKKVLRFLPKSSIL